MPLLSSVTLDQISVLSGPVSGVFSVSIVLRAWGGVLMNLFTVEH